MFIVLNREKISSYIVAFSTVIVLFIMSVVLNQKEVIQTATNTVINESVNSTGENATAINIGENYSIEDVERIINILDKESKVNFYVYKSWAEKNPDALKKIHDNGFSIFEIESNN